MTGQIDPYHSQSELVAALAVSAECMEDRK